MVFFTWALFDEMDEVKAIAAPNGSTTVRSVTFTYHNGDEAILKANRELSSTAC